MDFSPELPSDTTNTDMNSIISTDITQLAAIFDLLDLESNDDLDFIEFKVGLTSIGVNLTQDEAITLFESINAENEQYVNKEMFTEWLSKPSTSSTMDDIRNKLTSVLLTAQEINNPIQDMLDEDDIAHILGNKAEYIHVIEDIKNDRLSDTNNSDDTTKINTSNEEPDSDSMDSAERREIAKARKKMERRNSKKMAQNVVDDTQDLESSLMEQQMADLRKQQKYALNRATLSNRNVYKAENASKWEQEEIDCEFQAMNKQFRRLSQASLSIDQVQQEANKTMEAFRKMSNAESGDVGVGVGGQSVAKAALRTESLSDMLDADTVGVPSKLDVDFDVIDANAERSLSNKKLPRKIDAALSPPTNVTMAGGARTISPQPIQEIASTGTPHTTSTQPIMIGGSSQDNSRRNSASFSYGNQHPTTAYVVPANQGMTDISQYTAMQPMQQQLIYNNNRFNPQQNVVDIQHNVRDEADKHILIRLFIWYLSPMHDIQSLHHLWYHGANAVLSIVICFIMLSLLILAIATMPFCGVGLIFVYLLCILARHFAVIDSTFSYYFFGDKLINRFSIFIPKSHQQSIIGALKEYIFDPHILQVILYFTFIKLPAAFVLSGIAMVIFSGVASVLLSPLIFWLDSDYFRHGLYCLFGSKSYDAINDSVVCNGWAINSFGETFLAFLVFIPALPLTLHLSNFTAKLLIRITLNFLSINSPNSAPISNEIQKQSQLQESNVNVNYSFNTDNGARR